MARKRVDQMAELSQVAEGFLVSGLADGGLGSTITRTNMAPETRPSQKDISSSNHPFSGAKC